MESGKAHVDGQSRTPTWVVVTGRRSRLNQTGAGAGRRILDRRRTPASAEFSTAKAGHALRALLEMGRGKASSTLLGISPLPLHLQPRSPSYLHVSGLCTLHLSGLVTGCRSRLHYTGRYAGRFLHNDSGKSPRPVPQSDRGLRRHGCLPCKWAALSRHSIRYTSLLCPKTAQI